MKIEIAKILAKSPKERVLVIINHHAEISLGYEGFLSAQDVTALVASFKTDRELGVYSKYKEMFNKVQQFLINIHQIHLIYREEEQKIDKFLIIKKAYDDLKNLGTMIVNSPMDENLKSKTLELINKSTLQSLFEKVNDNGKFNFEEQLSKMIPCYQRILTKHQTHLKSAIQAFKDALKDHSFKVKAFERKIASIELQHNKKTKALLVDYFLIEKEDFDSAKVDQQQYKSFRETYL